MVGSLPGINKCANFQVEIFTGGRIYRILQGGGVEFPILHWFLHGNYNSAALLNCAASDFGGGNNHRNIEDAVEPFCLWEKLVS